MFTLKNYVKVMEYNMCQKCAYQIWLQMWNGEDFGYGKLCKYLVFITITRGTS